ncbi:9316_t:CDS:2 [Ambispora gerdemannii]|uniref:9316_t:CDS:1 n=1 Tax=Ambispora gerdemannii TaxID=144530 RepID=A0A9N8ZP65_9GLOM|nr:9316_t:CDS:2 [Ambispora gerdemannii]
MSDIKKDIDIDIDTLVVVDNANNDNTNTTNTNNASNNQLPKESLPLSDQSTKPNNSTRKLKGKVINKSVEKLKNEQKYYYQQKQQKQNQKSTDDDNGQLLYTEPTNFDELSPSPSPIQYNAEQKSNELDDIFNHIMSDIELLQQEQNDTEIPPLETIHKVLEEQDDLPTKYHFLMREYTSLRRKSSSLFTMTEEPKILESSQIIEDPPKISPLQPANFHVFSAKDYILFIVFILGCLFFVAMIGFYAIREMKYNDIYNYENNNSLMILMENPLVEGRPLAPAKAVNHNRGSKINNGPEVYYPISSSRKNENKNGCPFDSTHADAIRTTAPSAGQPKCFHFLIFHFCTGKSGDENSWFSS